MPPEPDNDRVVDYDEDTVMGEIQAAGRLEVGIASHLWAVGHRSAEHEPEGLGVDLGRDLAAALGVPARFVIASNRQLLANVEDDVLDVAFPSRAITERLVRKHAFTDPYFIAHQRLLVPRRSGIEDVDDLSGRVCSIADEATGISLEKINPEVTVVDRELCFGPEPATGPDLELITALRSFRAADGRGRGFHIVGDALTTEAYGAVVERGASAWVKFVDGVLQEYKAEGRWSESYARWIAPYVERPEREPPDMTVEEAAALFPAELE